MNSRFKLYIRDTINLIRSMVIKSESTVKLSNDLVIYNNGSVDLSRPETWKYYKNLAGEYHEIDVPMYIISHDNNERIIFNKENLKHHILTSKNYTADSTWVRDLMEEYKGQENLILGIVNPMDVGETIAAEDHKILSYSKHLVEGNEQYLIPELQKYINNFFILRHNKDYELIDSAYLIKIYSTLSTKLVLETIRLRHSQCRTNSAHSFHVRSFISSNSPIGQYFDYMSFEQRMWFYRNIRYLNRNLGTQKTFQLLMDNVLTNRGFSLVGYDLTKMAGDIEESIKSKSEMGQVILNGILPPSGVHDKSIDEILKNQSSIAVGNPEVEALTKSRLEDTVDRSKYGSLPTKVLESVTVDRTNIDPFTTIEIGINHWIYLSSINYYTATTNLTNPSNGDVYNLTMKDSFILYLYCYNKSLGIDLINVPNIRANRVLTVLPPNISELESLITRDIVSDNLLSKIVALRPPVEEMISPERFIEFCQEIQDYTFKLREIRFFSDGYKREGELHTVTERNFMDINVKLAEDDITYDNWLISKDINLEGSQTNDYLTIANELVKQAIGGEGLEANSFRKIHKVMMDIMMNLSSYSLQYLSKSNESFLKVIDGKFPGLDDNSYKEVIKFLYNGYNPRVIKSKGYVSDRNSLENELPDISLVLSGDIKANIDVCVTLLDGTKINNKVILDSILPTTKILPMPEFDISGEGEVINPVVPSINNQGNINFSVSGYDSDNLLLNLNR